jgi:hypothetical protein
MTRHSLGNWFFTAGLLLIAALPSPMHAQDTTGPIERALAEHHWELVEAEGVRVFFKAGTFAERHRHMLLRSAQTAVSEVLEFLGEPGLDQELRLIYVDSRQEMEALVGYPITGFAVWSENGVFLVINPDWRSFEKHEIAHVVTIGRWGAPDPTSRWMIEGIAVSCDGWCREYSIDEIARHLIIHDELPALPELFDDFGSLGEIRGGVYAASIIGFIRNTYGTAAVRRLWTNGIGDLGDATGVTIEEMEASWRQHLQQTFGAVDVDYEAIEANGCG